jgi:hypothetical protein
MKKKIIPTTKAAIALMLYVFCPHVSKAQRFSLGSAERVYPYTLIKENYFSVPFEYRNKAIVKFDEQNSATYIAPLFDDNGSVHHILWQIGSDGLLSFVGLSRELKGIFECRKPFAFYQGCIQETTTQIYALDSNKEKIACLVKWLNYCER